jgi:hypothetical protein
MLEAALSTSPVVTRLLVGALVRPQKHVSRAPPCRRNMLARALCITISDDRGDESFADDLNMGRGIVSGRVALLLRSTEIRPHRPNDLLPPSNSQTLGWLPFHTPHSTLGKKTELECASGLGVAASRSTLGQNANRDWASRRHAPHLAKMRIGTGPGGVTLHTWPKCESGLGVAASRSTLGQNANRDWASRRHTPHLAEMRIGTGPRGVTLLTWPKCASGLGLAAGQSTLGQKTHRDWASQRDRPHLARIRIGTGPRGGTIPANSDIGIPPGRPLK